MRFLGYGIMSEKVPCRWRFGEDKQSKEGIGDRVSGVVCMLGLILGLALDIGVASRSESGGR
jgi:hypothetical protein